MIYCRNVQTCFLNRATHRHLSKTHLLSHRTVTNFKAHYADILISETAAPEKKHFQPILDHRTFPPAPRLLMIQLSTIFLLVLALND